MSTLTIPNQNSDTYFQIWRKCNGYYECPKDDHGKRVGPLVGYVGKYQDKDGQEKQYVGDIYYNSAKIEENPQLLHSFAVGLSAKIRNAFDYRLPDYILAAPQGGLGLGLMVAHTLGINYGYPEKKITSLATSSQREQSLLIMNRHKIGAGLEVLVVEDICNNLSTAELIIQLIQQSGSSCIGIACAHNEGSARTYKSLRDDEYPIISLTHSPIVQFRQDDPCVREDIENGNIVWKPKDEWDLLIEEMQKAQKFQNREV